MERIAVQCQTLDEKRIVIQYTVSQGMRNTIYSPPISNDVISLVDGRNQKRDFYEKRDYKVISFKEFKEEFLNINNVGVECNTQEEVDRALAYIKHEKYTLNDFPVRIVISGDYPGSWSKELEGYTIISYKTFQTEFMKEEARQSEEIGRALITPMVKFKPGGIYVGELNSHFVLFKTKTGILSEECWYITSNEEYRHKMGFCPAPSVKFRDATEAEKQWLEVCIKENKYIPRSKMRSLLIGGYYRRGDWIFIHVDPVNYQCNNTALHISSRGFYNGNAAMAIINNSPDAIPATEEEIAWLDACIKVNRFVPYEKAIKPTEYIRGKWYKGWSNKCQLYAKFNKKENISGKLYFYWTEGIYKRQSDNTINYTKGVDCNWYYEVGLKEASLDEIQKYLPIEHPEKVNENNYFKPFEWFPPIEKLETKITSNTKTSTSLKTENEIIIKIKPKQTVKIN